MNKLQNRAVCLNKGNVKFTLRKRELYIFSHPEHILDNCYFNEYINIESSKSTKFFLVVDESHCIIDWGEDFRPEYRRLGELRSVINCRLLGLSATITNSGQKFIMKNLFMNNLNVISTSPTKENISLIVCKRPSANAKGNTACTPYDYIFMQLLEELNNLKNSQSPLSIASQCSGQGMAMNQQEKCLEPTSIKIQVLFRQHEWLCFILLWKRGQDW